jgi:hypothetical protein
MLFAVNLTVKAANDSNLRKRLFHETLSKQTEEEVHRPFKQQHESDTLGFATARNLVSFAPVGEELHASRSAETESVFELCQEISERATGLTSRHGTYKNDIESKAQKRNRKEEKRKRRDRKLEKAREKQAQRVEREAAEQEQSKRVLEQTFSDTSLGGTSTSPAESIRVECIECREHDSLLNETNGKRQRTDEFNESEIGVPHGENSKKPRQHMIPEKCSDTHVSHHQSLRLPFGIKLSSNVLSSGKTLASSRKQERPSNSIVEQWKEAPPSHSRQASLRKNPFERTAPKPSSSSLPFRSGIAKHHELHRPLMHGINSTSKEEGSNLNSQKEISGRQPMIAATSHPAAQENFASINVVPSQDPIQVLCTESFLETWGDLVCAVTANQWHQSYSGQSRSCLRDIRFIDSPLLDGCGVDMELADRGALLLICTSVLDEEAAARDIVVALAELVAADRYVYIYVLLIYDIATTPNVSLGICRLQNAVLQHGRQPPTRVVFKTSTASSLPESLAGIIISRDGMQTAKSKSFYEDLQNAQFCQQACLLRKLLPSMSGNGAIQCLTLARAITSPEDPYFSLMLTNKSMREQITMAVVSSPSQAPELSPLCMNQLTVLASANIGP